MVEDVKERCHLCNASLEDDEYSDKQLWFYVDDITRHYCSKCAELGEKVMHEFYQKSARKRALGEWYDAYELVRLTEMKYKDYHGRIKISFDNIFKYDESLVNSPITKDDVAIGVITDVTPEKVEGFIWDRYMPIVAELDHNQRPISFEIVY